MFNSTHHASAFGMRTEVGHFFKNTLNMPLKPGLSIEDQILLLKRRGMVFLDEKWAKGVLENNNYYRLNIYFHKCMDVKDHFEKGLTFEKIVSVYDNDRWLRNKLIFLIEPIEITIKSQIAYFLAIKYGPGCLYEKALFKNSIELDRIQKNFFDEVNRNSRDPVVVHHKDFYKGEFPIWVVVEFLSFNCVSRLFSIIQTTDRKQISKNSFGCNEEFLGQWLHVLSVLRNICAHFGYIYKREFAVRPKLYKEFGWNTDQNSTLFAIMLILRVLSKQALWNDFCKSLGEREILDKTFRLIDYGFPSDWKKYLGQLST